MVRAAGSFTGGASRRHLTEGSAVWPSLRRIPARTHLCAQPSRGCDGGDPVPGLNRPGPEGGTPLNSARCRLTSSWLGAHAPWARTEVRTRKVLLLEPERLRQLRVCAGRHGEAI